MFYDIFKITFQNMFFSYVCLIFTQVLCYVLACVFLTYSIQILCCCMFTSSLFLTAVLILPTHVPSDEHLSTNYPHTKHFINLFWVAWKFIPSMGLLNVGEYVYSIKNYLSILFIWVTCPLAHQKRESDPITDTCEPPCGSVLKSDIPSQKGKRKLT